MSRKTAALVAAFCICSGGVFAQDDFQNAKASFIFNGERVQISRDIEEAGRVSTQFGVARNNCGTDCIAPMQVATGVHTLGEREVLGFLVGKVAGNEGLMLDARMPSDRAKGYIPGTVNLPFATMAADNEFKVEILKALGVREQVGVFNFADARSLLIYDNGPTTNDAGLLITNLLAAGYPAEKIQYYRGGMQVWSILGFSIQEAGS